MLEGQRIGGLLLMGGSGNRFGSDLPKQFHRLAGKPVFLHTLEAFLSSHFFDEIILSCHPDWIEFTHKLLPVSPSCPIRVISGGTTRQESSYRGLCAFEKAPEIVVIHDAVRPFVSQETLSSNIRQTLLTGAVDTCIPSADTLVHAPQAETISSIPKRSDYLRGQTPQSFSTSLILAAHRQTARQNASDDCQLVLDLGHPVHVIQGEEANLKITSELDLILAEQILLRQRMGQRAAPFPSGKIAIVGGTGGIGSILMQKIQALGGEAIALSRRTTPHLDLSDPVSIQIAFAALGPLAGLINCAGKFHLNPLHTLSLSEIEEAIAVNLRGPILCCKMAQLKQGAHVINIASSSFSRGRKNMSLYSAAKAGLVNFTQGWAEERLDLCIHTVIPERTNTAMRRENFPGEDPSTLLDPEIIANTILDLLFQKDLTGLSANLRASSKNS